MPAEPIIRQETIGAFQVNTYLIACPRTKQAVVIDPAGSVTTILAMIDAAQAQPIYILNTHGHADHVLANKKLQAALSVPICMHEADDDFFADQEIRRQSEKELGLSAPDRADLRLVDTQVLSVGDLAIHVIHTPGHTPGSVCFLVEGNLFSGDTLFVGDVGRSDLAGGSFTTLLSSLKEKIIVLPPATRVWPGHNYGETPTSTLDWEMRENPYITDFILAE